jgi:formylglycine-generating enzyme required for sulfatase activity
LPSLVVEKEKGIFHHFFLVFHVINKTHNKSDTQGKFAMNKTSSRLFLVISLLVLISSACNNPMLSQFQPDAGPSDDSSDAGSIDNNSGSSDSEFDAPHNTDGAEITLIPGAIFQIGSLASDTLADEDEFPLHQVSVDEFHIYTY